MKAEENTVWEKLSYEEKNRQLYLTQKETMQKFLERHAISEEQYEEGLHGLEKMGFQE